jgi:prepilin-type N-terminal cleavage/methylation domain-containing protein
LTLVELLVVLAVVGILAAAAAPSLFEASARSKVAAAKSQTRTLAAALEAYAIDYHGYPPTSQQFPDDPLGLLAYHQLPRLTTPVAYIHERGFHDPFGLIATRDDVPAQAILDPIRATLELRPANERRSLLYFQYPTLFERIGATCVPIKGASVASIGPDAKDSLGAYRPVGVDCFRNLFSESKGFPGPPESKHPINGLYDPTNGTWSNGDIVSFVGQAAQFSNK